MGLLVGRSNVRLNISNPKKENIYNTSSVRISMGLQTFKMFIKNWVATVGHRSLGAGIGFDRGPFGLVTSDGSDWGFTVQVVCEHRRTLGMAERFRGAAQSAVIDGRSRSWRRRFTVERLTYFGLLVFGRSQTGKGSLNVDEIRARLLLTIVDRPAK